MKEFVFTSVQEEWLTELETTNKKQGKQYLKIEVDSVYQYCCLGIACEMFDSKSLIRRTKKSSYFSIHGFNSSLPLHIKEKLNFRTTLGETHPSNLKDVYKLNDSGEYTFKQIAKIIRENPEDYFNNNDKS